MDLRSAARRAIPVALIVVELVVTIAATWVFVAAHGRVPAPDRVPRGSTVVVFGSLVSDGEPGAYVRGRLDTALDLYRSGAAARIINSGNGSADAGDEPAVMRTYLEQRGVPSGVIVDDPAGFDTADTCRRLHTVYDVERPVLITQDFHVPRAIALCRSLGVDATGVDARCECSVITQARNVIREALLARPRALVTAVTGW
ncbi:SanA/YdcF family protein [Gordonia polyisoprenivorans]|uniref:SanA/YdcF family protein n=1 Tax=Gordonia polyisoprenivorans TaxID=84595 RepID=UPI001AD64F43|nr:ElyC/SanA/YdcF family protein [Gordonia polyisoprenivorans]QTI69170.1 YdcF family protein [Gordonia polyisoprenivorans]